MTRRLVWILVAVALAGCLAALLVRGRYMRDYRKTKELTAIAEFDHDGGRSGEGGSSWPIPIKEGGEVHVAFFFFHCIVRPDDPRKWPPNAMTVLDPKSGAVLRSTKVKAKDIGLDWPESQPLKAAPSRIAWPKDAEVWRVYSRLGDLAPAIWEAYEIGGEVTEPTLKKTVIEFRKLWYMTIQGEFIPYYDFIGKDFQAWMDGVKE